MCRPHPRCLRPRQSTASNTRHRRVCLSVACAQTGARPIRVLDLQRDDPVIQSGPRGTPATAGSTATKNRRGRLMPEEVANTPGVRETRVRRRAQCRLSGLSALCAVMLLSSVAQGCDGSRVNDGEPIGSRAEPSQGLIIFSRGFRDDLYAMAPTPESRVRRLTTLPGGQFDPSWSPDGLRIVFRDSRAGVNNNDEIYVMRAGGSLVRNLTHNPANDWVSSVVARRHAGCLRVDASRRSTRPVEDAGGWHRSAPHHGWSRRISDLVTERSLDRLWSWASAKRRVARARRRHGRSPDN
jgi:WD40-like Beta Propeller Repeat